MSTNTNTTEADGQRQAETERTNTNETEGSRHTPGPWTTPGEDGGERVICYTKDNGQRGTLAHVYDGKAGTMEANARLIAAAPETKAQRDELLAACKAQHTAIDILLAMLIERDHSFMPTKSQAWPLMIAGNAAIARAEGSSAPETKAQRDELLAICEDIAGSGCDLGNSERRIRLYAAITKAGGAL